MIRKTQMKVDPERVLVVDDEEAIRHVLGTYLKQQNYAVTTSGSTEQALELLRDYEPGVALVDLVMPGRNGLELLTEIKQRYPDTEVVMITSHASAEAAVGAIRRGAHDFLQKPFDNLREVGTAVEQALQKRQAKIELRGLTEAADRLPPK